MNDNTFYLLLAAAWLAGYIFTAGIMRPNKGSHHLALILFWCIFLSILSYVFLYTLGGKLGAWAKLEEWDEGLK